MNKILLKIMLAAVKEHLPEVSMSDLEDNGAVYYMNGKNGTEFDWYVNEKVSDFMMFYNDEDNIKYFPLGKWFLTNKITETISAKNVSSNQRKL